MVLRAWGVDTFRVGNGEIKLVCFMGIFEELDTFLRGVADVAKPHAFALVEKFRRLT